MKKILVLLFSVALGTAGFAQTRGDVILGQQNRPGYGNASRGHDRLDARERDAMISRINRSYDLRIASIQRDRRLRNAEKKRMVRSLERERKLKIREVRERYRDRNYRSYGGHDRWD